MRLLLPRSYKPLPQLRQCRCLQRPCRRVYISVQVAASKGFGNTPKKKKAEDPQEPRQRKAQRIKGKGKKAFRSSAPQQPPQDQSQKEQFTQGLDPNQVPSLEASFKEELDRRSGSTPQSEFESRLAALKENSTLLAKEKAINDQKNQGPLSSSDDAYANPPSILSTISGKKEDDPDKVNPLGNNQLAVVAGTLLLGAVLIFSSLGPGGDFVQQAGISPEEKAKFEAQLTEFEATLSKDANDVSALEGAAVTYANLQNYKKSETLLVQLSQLKSDDPDVWRLLAETRIAEKELGKAVTAYAEAYRLAGDDLEILKGYSGALVADGKPADAVQLVKAASAQLRRDLSDGAPMSATPIELDLLLAKVYSQWRGHTTDAFATYDTIIQENPADFRGYLAKGVLLRQEGRKSDADRAFLNARFMAPKELRSIVDRVAAPEVSAY